MSDSGEIREIGDLADKVSDRTSSEKIYHLWKSISQTPRELSEPVSYTHLTLPTTPYV